MVVMFHGGYPRWTRRVNTRLAAATRLAVVPLNTTCAMGRGGWGLKSGTDVLGGESMLSAGQGV